MDKFVKVDILKHNGEDCSNHGVTSRVNETILFAEFLSLTEIEQICKDKGFDIHNALQIKTKRFSFGTFKHAQPVELLDRHTCFGGCFAYSCFAPFGRMLGSEVNSPISIHDHLPS